MKKKNARLKEKQRRKNTWYLIYFFLITLSLYLFLSPTPGVHLGMNFVVFTVIFPSMRIGLSVLHFFLTEKVGEKGHVKPANFLDTHEKFLIGVATKGGTCIAFVC